MSYDVELSSGRNAAPQAIPRSRSASAHVSQLRDSGSFSRREVANSSVGVQPVVLPSQHRESDVKDNDGQPPRALSPRRVNTEIEDDWNCYSKCMWHIDQAVTPTWLYEKSVDVAVYNTFLMSELILESLPQAMVNIIATWFLLGTSTISLISLSFSGSIILYHITSILYHVGIKNEDVNSFLL